MNPPSTVERISLADGSTLGTVCTAFPVALTTDLAGRPKRRRLFPLSWDTDHDDHVGGGPALRLTGESGEALVHACRVYHSRSQWRRDVFIVRRGYPDGALQWLFTTDHSVTALDTDGDTVFAPSPPARSWRSTPRAGRSGGAPASRWTASRPWRCA